MVNKVILLGNVGADPEIRSFEDGSKVARVNIATTERIYNPVTQERTEKTEWHRVTMWRGLANVVEQYVRKGSQLYIEGRLRNSEWTDANGQKRYGVEIHADVMNMVGSRRDNGMQQQQGYQPQQGGYQPQQQGGYQQQYGGGQNNVYGQPQQPAQQPMQQQPMQQPAQQQPVQNPFSQPNGYTAQQAKPAPAPAPVNNDDIDDLPF